jgi:hypothetical protein
MWLSSEERMLAVMFYNRGSRADDIQDYWRAQETRPRAGINHLRHAHHDHVLALPLCLWYCVSGTASLPLHLPLLEQLLGQLKLASSREPGFKYRISPSSPSLVM